MTCAVRIGRLGRICLMLAAAMAVPDGQAFAQAKVNATDYWRECWAVSVEFRTDLALSPADTLTPESEINGVKFTEWFVRSSVHAPPRKSPELRADAARKLRELAKSAPSEDVRKRAQAMLEYVEPELGKN